MHVDVVNDFESFARLEADWDAAYAADPEAHIFLSWFWFEKWLRRRSEGWFVLAARPSADAPRHVAFFPLRIVDRKWKDGWFYNEVQAACTGFADCTGFICRPEFEAEALDAFGVQLTRLNWAQVALNKLCSSDRRLSLLLQPLAADRFETEIVEHDMQDGIDLFRCPYAALPDDWERYLAESLSANSRQKARRFLRKVEGEDAYRITHADAGTIERDVGALLALWKAKWGARKRDRLDDLLESNRAMLRHCFDNDALFLPILWKGEQPLAALGILKDEQRKNMSFFIGGRDDAFKEVPPAFVLHLHSIRHAIAEGFRRYDFLRGDEPYKFSFATDEYRLRRVLVTTRDRKNLGGKLPPGSLPFAFKRSFALHEKRKLAEAAMGYRQILETDPRHGTALYCLGQIQAEQGDHRAAIDTFETYVAVKTTTYKGWYRLGLSLAALGDHAAAAKNFAETVRREPGYAPAHARLAASLAVAGRHAEALAAIETGLASPPKKGEANPDFSAALAALGKASRAEREPHAARFAALGDRFRQRDEFERAVECYRLALDATPQSSAPHWGLGRAYEGLGKNDDACESYLRALELEPCDTLLAAGDSALVPQ